MTAHPEENEKTSVDINAVRSLAIDLIVSKGLYSSFSDEDAIGMAAAQLIRSGNLGTFDCYCVRCKRVTPFIIREPTVNRIGGALRKGDLITDSAPIHVVASVCQRDLASYTYAFIRKNKRFIKIGQFPSFSDIAFGELKDIDGSLSDLDRKELGTAIGLFSHDAASGAFTYLRRVFERMIRRAHERFSAREGPISEFETLRMDEKIAALKSELPERLIKNRRVFGVLSQGIHELTDEQCMLMFPLLKAVIFQMLEQEEHRRKKDIAEKETDSAIQALIASRLGFEVDDA